MAERVPLPVVNYNKGIKGDNSSIGLGTVIVPRERANGSTTASIAANVRGTADIGNGNVLMGSASIPVEAEKAANLASVRELINPDAGRAVVGVRNNGNSIVYTRSKDSNAVDANVDLDGTGLGLGYNQTTDGRWNARANLNTVLQGLNVGAGVGVTSEGRQNLLASLRSKNFSMSGGVTKQPDGARSYDARASYNYKF